MTEPTRNSRKPLIIAGVALLTVAAVVWGLVGGAEQEQQSSLPKELSVESLKAQASDPGKMRDTMEQLNRDDLTDEQRRELRGNVRQVWRSVMLERVDEYFAAAEEERQAILDRHIDEFQERMKQWRARREEREREREDEERSDRRDWFGSRSQADRKADSEGRNPDEMAQMMVYFSAIRQRMSERGIEMPWGRGGRGGPGRGRGSGGGGRGGGRGSGGRR